MNLFKKIWNSAWVCIISAWFVAVCEFIDCAWMSGAGWTFVGVLWWGLAGERKFYDELYRLYHEHLDLCEKRDLMLEEALEKLKKYEPEDEDGSDKP